MEDLTDEERIRIGYKNTAERFEEFLEKLTPKDLYSVIGEMELNGIFPEKEEYAPNDILTCDHCRQIDGGRCIEEENEGMLIVK